MTDVTHYLPAQPLSRQLLHSIIKKVFLWVQNLGLDTTHGSFEGLTWHFPLDENCYLEIDLGDQALRFEWDRNLLEPTMITCNHENALDIPNNLDWFVGVEKIIYDKMERLNDRVERERLERGKAKA